MQNNLHELWALLNYLHPSIFTVSEPFDNAFDMGAETISIDRKTLDAAHHLLRPLMLRRLKTEVRDPGVASGHNKHLELSRVSCGVMVIVRSNCTRLMLGGVWTRKIYDM